MTGIPVKPGSDAHEFRGKKSPVKRDPFFHRKAFNLYGGWLIGYPVALLRVWRIQANGGVLSFVQCLKVPASI